MSQHRGNTGHSSRTPVTLISRTRCIVEQASIEIQHMEPIPNERISPPQVDPNYPRWPLAIADIRGLRTRQCKLASYCADTEQHETRWRSEAERCLLGLLELLHHHGQQGGVVAARDAELIALVLLRAGGEGGVRVRLNRRQTDLCAGTDQRVTDQQIGHRGQHRRS